MQWVTSEKRKKILPVTKIMRHLCVRRPFREAILFWTPQPWGGAIERKATRDNRLLPSDQSERRRGLFLEMNKSGQNCRKRLKKGFRPTVYRPKCLYRWVRVYLQSAVFKSCFVRLDEGPTNWWVAEIKLKLRFNHLLNTILLKA